ncbi:hypothetical protein Tco_1406086 [Tanacetum coccineum]
MGGYKHKQLMGKSYDEIKKLFDKEMKRVNTFVAMSSEAQESNEKKEEDEVEEVEEDDEAELKKHLVIKKDDDIAIDAIPLATKPSVIVDYKLLKEGIMVHYQLIRADGSSKRYSSIIRMLQGIDREDLLTLWKLVKTKYGDIRPEDEHERVMWGYFKVMFEPDIRSKVWRDYKIQKMNIKFRGGLLELKRLQGFLEVTTAQESSQPQSSYEAAATLREFKLKKILIDKTDKSESYLAAPEHKECYEGLKKSYDLDKTIFSTYGKVYSLKRSRKDKDKDEDPFAGSDRGLKKRKTSKDCRTNKKVEVMRKHGYGYLKEIVVGRAANDLYIFKEGDFLRLRINDIEYMLLLISSKVTKPETTKFEIRKRDPYTPYQDPQGFIYVDNKGRNRLMRSDELYKFSDRTLTRLRTLLDDITKNIQMEYLPNRRWSTLEKKRANIMIKAIDKQMKERRLIRSLKKFVGGRHYETDLWLLQRTI